MILTFTLVIFAGTLGTLTVICPASSPLFCVDICPDWVGIPLADTSTLAIRLLSFS